MANTSIYFRTELDTKVSLLANQLNGDMEEHLLKNLKNKVEGKIIDAGIVIRINRLIKYDYGIIGQVNFMGTTVYNVKYECYICSPTIESEIICVVENFVPGYIVCTNGPITIVVAYNSIDTQKFKIENNQVINLINEKPIVIGEYIRVTVVNIKKNAGTRTMIIYGKLMDYADDDEIMTFKNDESIVSGNNMISDTDNFI